MRAVAVRAPGPESGMTATELEPAFTAYKVLLYRPDAPANEAPVRARFFKIL
jgi:hypothetical protein